MASPRRSAPETELLERLRNEEFELLGRMPWSSNGTYLVEFVCPEADSEADPLADPEAGDDGDDAEGDGGLAPAPGKTRAVYKPGRGERPLWDFPSGLYRREAAAYELAAALGWWVVPPTIVRDGPLGEGSVQWFIDADFRQHYFTLQDETTHHWDFQAICALDLVANNTDRKSGHCLLGRDGYIWAIDNGLCFAEESKLRTVIWEFGGEPLPPEMLTDLTRLAESGFGESVTSLLDDDEVWAMHERLDELIEAGHFPEDRGGHRYPWPLV